MATADHDKTLISNALLAPRYYIILLVHVIKLRARAKILMCPRAEVAKDFRCRATDCVFSNLIILAEGNFSPESDQH